MSAAFYDELYAALSSSRAYKRVLSRSTDLPDELLPLSALTRTTLERIVGALNSSPESRILELACGLGTVAQWVAARTGAYVMATDYAPSAIESARAIAAQRHVPRVEFAVADATCTGLPAASFDAVYCIDSLQFVQPEVALEEIARVLKPGGVVVVTTWEAIADVPLATVVRDYRPLFETAGLRVDRHDFISDARQTESAYYRAIIAEAQGLRDDMGRCAEPVIEEAESMLAKRAQPPRVRKIFIVAHKFDRDAPASR